ncbi:glycosyltransferase family 4 protein [Candidatus Latescibacterota bacterium]
MKITFVLPGYERSGGVRVTVEMANRLLRLGYDVRIVYRVSPLFSINTYKKLLRTSYYKICNYTEISWLQNSKCKLQSYIEINDIDFEKGEIVIAVGTYTIKDVYNIHKDIIKIRYCHGFSEYLQELTNEVWGLSMPTISVSDQLITRIKELSGEEPLDVVPNGINTDEYFIENKVRDGIGAVFSLHYSKAPEFTIELMCKVHERWPDLAQYVFSTDSKPKELKWIYYIRFPSIALARDFYNRSKIWCITSRSEGFCLPILEAMACGCAVVSTNLDTAPGLIKHAENGFIVPFGNINAFIEYIEILLNNENLRYRLVQKDLDTIKKFTWDNAVSKMDSVLRRIKESS